MSERDRTDEGEREGGFFDRPLWRIIIPIILLSFAVHRGAAAVIAHVGEAGTFAVVLNAAQALLVLGAAIAIFSGRPHAWFDRL